MRMRQDRVREAISRSTLALRCGITKRRVAYYEDADRSDDELPVSYLKTIAKGLGFEEDHYMNEYHRFLDSDYGSQIDEYIQKKGFKIWEAEKHFGVKEFALLSWRKGETCPPRYVYEMIKNEGSTK